MVKIFRAVWFVTLMCALAALLYVYASLSQNVTVWEEDLSLTVITRESFFYSLLAFLAITNVLIYVVKPFYKRDDFLLWFYGLIITLNIFFIISIGFIAIYNSGEQFDFNYIGVFIYGSVFLVALWAIGWPVYALIKKLSHKPAVWLDILKILVINMLNVLNVIFW